jgi:hypothetical protein
MRPGPSFPRAAHCRVFSSLCLFHSSYLLPVQILVTRQSCALWLGFRLKVASMDSLLPHMTGRQSDCPPRISVHAGASQKDPRAVRGLRLPFAIPTKFVSTAVCPSNQYHRPGTDLLLRSQSAHHGYLTPIAFSSTETSSPAI